MQCLKTKLIKEGDIMTIDQIEKYFSGLEIVGLMQSQSGYKNYLNEKYVSQFKNNF